MAKATKGKAAEVKTEAKVDEVKEVVAEKAEETVKAEAKTETKAETKKAAAKKTAAKAEPVIKCTIEFQDKNTTIRSIVDSIYEAEGGKDNIQTLDIYIQPENSVAYYVVNGEAEGKSVNF